MHFRVRKNVVQLVRMSYDAELGRGRAVVVGSVKLAEPVLPDELTGKLTPDERAEFEGWVATRHREDELKAELAALTLAEQMEMAQGWFERQADSETARAVANEIAARWPAFRRKLVKHGLLE